MTTFGQDAPLIGTSAVVSIQDASKREIPNSENKLAEGLLPSTQADLKAKLDIEKEVKAAKLAGQALGVNSFRLMDWLIENSYSLYQALGYEAYVRTFLSVAAYSAMAIETGTDAESGDKTLTATSVENGETKSVTLKSTKDNATQSTVTVAYPSKGEEKVVPPAPNGDGLEKLYRSPREQMGHPPRLPSPPQPPSFFEVLERLPPKSDSTLQVINNSYDTPISSKLVYDMIADKQAFVTTRRREVTEKMAFGAPSELLDIPTGEFVTDVDYEYVVVVDVVGDVVRAFVLKRRSVYSDEYYIVDFKDFSPSEMTEAGLIELKSRVIKDFIPVLVETIGRSPSRVAETQSTAAAFTFLLHMVPTGAAIDYGLQGEYGEMRISIAGDMLLFLGPLAKLATAARSGKVIGPFASTLTKAGNALPTARKLHGAAIAGELTISGVRSGQGLHALYNGDNEAAAGYLGEAVLRLFGVTISTRGFKRASADNLIRNVGDDVTKWLGKDAKVITNEFGDTLIESADGLRQIRFDFKHPYPHKNPHAHLIEYKWVKNKKVEISNQRIYVQGVIPE